jgi:hypothetical protein
VKIVFEEQKGEIAMSDKLIKTAIALVLFISLFACSELSAAPTPSAAEIEKEEQAVYSFFVSGQSAPVLILEETSTNIGSDDPQQTIDYIKSGLKSVSNETIENYLARNPARTKLSTEMDLGVEYKLLSAEELKKISSQSNWGEVLSEAYPGSYGYTIFSRVGFNDKLDQALIYVGSVAGPLMGSGSYFLMEKQFGEWLMKERIEVWIS